MARTGNPALLCAPDRVGAAVLRVRPMPVTAAQAERPAGAAGVVELALRPVLIEVATAALVDAAKSGSSRSSPCPIELQGGSPDAYGRSDFHFRFRQLDQAKLGQHR